MRHYLLTWYGMTDLRAALGLEETDGPVLSALKTGDYSDAVILAYTSAAKQQHAFVGELRDEWEEWFTTPTPDRPSLSVDQVNRFLDVVGNTESGHELFAAWLRSELNSLGVEVRIQVIPQVLQQLNDAPGIHKAAAAAVRTALNDPEPKRVTTYVSPGTPVMAYTWALIARSNPQLRIEVISSSDPRNPPEHVELPRELLDSSIGVPAGQSSQDYDLVIHLLGAQALPVFFGLRQFQAKKNLIITTSRYENDARRLAKLAEFAPTPIIIPDPFKPDDTRKAITRQVNKLPADARIAINMTGGTKMMFTGALSACWELGLDPVYFEITHHNVIYLRDGNQVPFVGISDVEDFMRASGFGTVSAGRWSTDPTREQRLSATRDIWRSRSALKGLYGLPRFREFGRNSGSDHNEFEFRWNRGKASLEAEAHLTLDGFSIQVPSRGFFKYLSGGWLEEYVYSLLRPLEESGAIRDLRIGLEVGFPTESKTEREMKAQEFDCAFTDGKRLWIVECKAGTVQQEAIQKLENNVMHYGGVAGRGILVSAGTLTQANRKRIDTLPSILAVLPEELTTETLGRIIRR